MWLWIIAGLALLFLVVILILCIPLDVVLTIDSTSENKFRLRIAWFFGLIGFEALPYFDRMTKRKRASRFSMRKLLAIIGIKGLTSCARNLLKDVCSKIRIKELTLRLRLGMGEPALFGIIYGMVSFVKPLLRLPAQYRMDVEPSFTSQYTFEGNAHCTLRVQPVRMILPFFRFLVSSPGRRAARIMLSKK